MILGARTSTVRADALVGCGPEESIAGPLWRMACAGPDLKRGASAFWVLSLRRWPADVTLRDGTWAVPDVIAATCGIERFAFHVAAARYGGARAPDDVLAKAARMAEELGLADYAAPLASIALATLCGRGRCPSCKRRGNRKCQICKGHVFFTDADRTIARLLGIRRSTWQRRYGMSYLAFRGRLEDIAIAAAYVVGRRLDPEGDHGGPFLTSTSYAGRELEDS